MKLLIKFFVAATIFLTTSVAFAGPSPDLTIKSEGTKSFTLYLNQIKSKSIQVRIQDEKSFRLVDEAVTQLNGTFAKKYNLVNLPAGKYSLEIEDDFMIKHQPIEIRNNELVIENEKLEVIYKPVISVKDLGVELNFLQLKDAATVIEFLDNSGNVLYTEAIPENGSIHRLLNVSKLDKGVYTMNVFVAGRSFTKEIAL